MDSLQKLIEQLPDFATADELVSAGLFRSKNLLYRLRQAKKGPPFFQPSERTVRYPKNGLKEYFKERSFNGLSEKK